MLMTVLFTAQHLLRNQLCPNYSWLLTLCNLCNLKLVLNVDKTKVMFSNKNSKSNSVSLARTASYVSGYPNQVLIRVQTSGDLNRCIRLVAVTFLSMLDYSGVVYMRASSQSTCSGYRIMEH